ncbi:MAG TPA: hypothetical protein VFN35_24055 [Ktedonobacteraceae bacterium]|nr:hypothetical protein [Ktedonobacteraceae bacterium]
MIQVLIVDDHAIVRQGIRFVLEQQPDIVVVGDGSDGRLLRWLPSCFQM